MKLNQKILKVINESIRKSLLSFDDVQFDQSKLDNTNKKVSNTIADWKFIQENFVDLDLPSGVLWAKCNLGAENPEEDGDYYSFGEIKPKGYYLYGTYKYGRSSHELTKYCTMDSYGQIDGKYELDIEDDAAYQLNNNMCIPSAQIFNELIRNTDNEWTTLNGKTGYKFISKMDPSKFIFLPAAGQKKYDRCSAHGLYGCYMTNSVAPNFPSEVIYVIFSNNGRPTTYGGSRGNYGYSIRPICKIK